MLDQLHEENQEMNSEIEHLKKNAANLQKQAQQGNQGPS